MSKTDSLHYKLCCKCATYLRSYEGGEKITYEKYDGTEGFYIQQPYKFIAVELVTGAGELPDVWGMTGFDSVMVEVKISHNDFLADQKKRSRREENKYKIGNYRYYLCPAGVISKDELPEGWGLLEWDGKHINKVVQAKKFDVFNKSELMLLSSILSREVGRSKIFNYRKTKNKY